MCVNSLCAHPMPCCWITVAFAVEIVIVHFTMARYPAAGISQPTAAVGGLVCLFAVDRDFTACISFSLHTDLCRTDAGCDHCRALGGLL